MTKKRLQINIRSNEYIEALIREVVETEPNFDNKTEFVHAAIEFVAIELLGREKCMEIQFEKLQQKQMEEMKSPTLLRGKTEFMLN